MEKIFTFSVLGLLAGCSATMPDMGTAQPIHYQCDNDRNFQITFNKDKALLQLPKEDYALKRAVSASGMKYISDDGMPDISTTIIFQGKGNEASLDLGRVLLKNCTVMK
ncbi:MliC family protein [Aliivibrio wodanis]|uniref:MliC family protein n=1 Tax=Aliivibrio wodanis TaxID=80852 RepID=UPI00406CF631